MAYRPKMKKGGSYGPQGVAKIEVNPKNKNQIRFTLKARSWDKSTESEKVEIVKGQVKREDCGEKIRDLIKPGIWFISINSDKDKIYGIRPVDGVFDVVVDHFSAAENTPPAPKTHQGKDWAYEYFSVILRIVNDGDEKGMEIPYVLRYHFDKEFEPVDGEKPREVVAYSHPRSKYTPPLIDFLEATGAWERGPMPYRDNILPTLEKRIKEQNRTFKVVLSGGNIKSILGGSQEFSEEFETPDVEE